MYQRNCHRVLKARGFSRTTVIEHLRATTDTVYSHYFDFRDNTGSKSGYKGFLLNMLQQFSDLQGIHPALQELYIQCKRGQNFYQPTNLQLENTLNVMIQQSTSGYIVLDAMDECNGEDKPYVLNWVEQVSANISIAVTSRYFPEDQGANSALRIIALNNNDNKFRIEEDISIFLEKQIQMQIHLKGSLKNQVLDTLKLKAQGQ